MATRDNGNGCCGSANTGGVFHLRSPNGKYKMNFSEADAACQAEDATLASFKQLGDAQQVKTRTSQHFTHVYLSIYKKKCSNSSVSDFDC